MTSSKVGCFRKLLIKRGLMHQDPPRRSNQQGAASKENVRDLKSKYQRPDKLAGTAANCKGKDKSAFAKMYNRTLDSRKVTYPSPWFSRVRCYGSTTWS